MTSPPTMTPSATTEHKNYRPLIAVVGAIIVAAALIVARSDLYTPGSDLGYYMGLAGSVMMLTLLLYPLRKHVRFLHALGALKHWFRLHMFFGIAGPTLILFHSKFSFGSLNAAVALLCMLLVAGSGIIGRFIYRRIHHGLYGQRATVQELHDAVGVSGGEVKSKFHFAPTVEQRLKEYGEMARSPTGGWVAGAFRFMTLGLRGRIAHYRAMRELRIILSAHARTRGWDNAKFKAKVRAADDLIWNYLRAVQKEAQFAAYARLFSLWHVAHVPFVYMLVISGVVHVIAVHMY